MLKASSSHSVMADEIRIEFIVQEMSRVYFILIVSYFCPTKESFKTLLVKVFFEHEHDSPSIHVDYRL